MIQPPDSLVENVITLIAYDTYNGRSAIDLVTPNLFSGDYRLIAERVLEFWRVHRQAPGPHTPDLFEDVFAKQNASTEAMAKADNLRHILAQMRALSEAMNATYIVASLGKFVRLQTLKSVTIKAAEVLQRNDDVAVEEAEKLYSEVLSARQVAFHSGVGLEDVDFAMHYLEQSTQNDILLGIGPMDRNRMALRAGTATILIGEAKIGKTWFLIHCATQAIKQRKRVVHVTLENDEGPTLIRYYQSFFHISKRTAQGLSTQLLIRGDRLDGITQAPSNPIFTLDPEGGYDTELELNNHVRLLGRQAQYLKIKRFPMRVLTVDGLKIYLDKLEQDGFIPDVLIVDYPKIMKIATENYRISLGHTLEDLRGICTERNVAGLFVHQASKEGAKSGFTQATHAGEDWSVVATCDNVMTFSRTLGEKTLGLGRLFVDRARDEKDGYQILITQNYELGQFVTSSYELPDNYVQYIEEFGVEQPEEGEGDV